MSGLTEVILTVNLFPDNVKVLLWEIFNEGENPYAWMTNEQVYHYVTSEQKIKQQNTPIEMFDILLRCIEFKPGT